MNFQDRAIDYVLSQNKTLFELEGKIACKSGFDGVSDERQEYLFLRWT